uniref:putative pentatricopeptide repeat-containing protein At1g12700, mitochondrial n=1 Tax=Erigeron canadensis TaxID=72917 RepID=UPI001CB98537|nr:putative pentatricopeptide repeat-containing protein At1g12700, mitochondrial [Erigeron canadensis]
MKLPYTPSSFHLRRPISSFFTPATTPPPYPPPSPPHHFTYFQSILDQIKLLSKTPPKNPSLTTLVSLINKPHLLNSATSLILIDYLSQINKIGRAKLVLSHLKKSRNNISDHFLYSLVFDFIIKDGTINDVENVWSEICGSSKSFDFFSEYVIFVCKFGGLVEIKDVYERLLMSNGSVIKRQCYVALCGALCNVNEGLLAKNVVTKMYDKCMDVDNWTYFSMFRCFCRNGDIFEADLVLRKLVENGFVIDICVYGTFLHGLCKSGKYREANKLFKKLSKRVPAGGFGEKRLMLREGRRAIFQLKCEGVVPEMMVYESYFRALCSVGKLDEAEVLLKKMISGRTLPEICVYGSFIKALFRVGRDEDAMKFFKTQKKKGLVRVDEIGSYVIMQLCEKGKTDDALKLFEEIAMVKGFVNGSDICNSILDSYWKEKCVAKAENFFEKWRSSEGNYGRPNIMSYTVMLNGYCNHNDVAKALMVFKEILKSKMVVNGALYERIISVLCDCGRVSEAFEYLNDMIESGHFGFCKRWRTFFQSVLTADEHSILIES